MKHSWNILSGSSNRISWWIPLGGARRKERGGGAAPSPCPLQRVTAECGVCTHGAWCIWREEREINPPRAGIALCLTSAAMSVAHTRKSSPTPTPVGLPGCRRARWPSRAELHAWGEFSSSRAFTSLLEKVVLLGSTKMWQPGGSNPQQGMNGLLCLSLWKAVFPASHQTNTLPTKFFFISCTGYQDPPCLTLHSTFALPEQRPKPCITDRYQCSQGVSLFPPSVFAFDLWQPVGYKIKLCMSLGLYLFRWPWQPKTFMVTAI